VGSGHPIIELTLAPSERLEGAARQIGEAIARARAIGSRGLLVVVPPGGVPVPSAAERVAMVRGWAALAGGRVRVALVVEPGLLDDERLGVVAAAGFGLQGEAFDNEVEARDWLEQPA
jgi:hypothetical protein